MNAPPNKNASMEVQVGVNNMQGKMITMDFDAFGYAFILSSFLIILLMLV